MCRRTRSELTLVVADRESYLDIIVFADANDLCLSCGVQVTEATTYIPK